MSTPDCSRQCKSARFVEVNPRGVVSDRVGDVKIEVSARPVPVHPNHIEALKARRQAAGSKFIRTRNLFRYRR